MRAPLWLPELGDARAPMFQNPPNKVREHIQGPCNFPQARKPTRRTHGVKADTHQTANSSSRLISGVGVNDLRHSGRLKS